MSEERWHLITAELERTTSYCSVVYRVPSAPLGCKQKAEKHDKRADALLDELGGGG
jgi:hypothetical protein